MRPNRPERGPTAPSPLRPDLAARLAGALFIVATASYAAGNTMLEGALRSAGPGAVPPSAYGAALPAAITLMLVNSAAVVGIGALFFPVLQRYDPSVAAAYLATRVVESVVLAVGELGLLLPLHARTAAALDGAISQALGDLAVRWHALAYQTAMAALGLGSLAFTALLYRSRLVPRPLAAWGAVGYAALFVSALLGLWGAPVSLLWYLPGGTFEVALPLWLFIKGLGAEQPGDPGADAGALARLSG